MRGLRGVLAGSLALITLHTLVAYRGPSQHLAQLAGPNGLAVGIVNAFLSPDRPGIPERNSTSSSGGSTSVVSGLAAEGARNIGRAVTAAGQTLPAPAPR